MKRRLGWRKDQPDMRDLTLDHPEIKSMLPLQRQALPSKVDLRGWDSPVRNQGDLGSCTAHAGTSLLEHIEKRTIGEMLDASRLFLYKATRTLMGETGDTGATLRDTMKALVMIGVPPEKYWPYDVSTFDNEPKPILYAVADNYKALKYFRLDNPGGSGVKTLENVKKSLAHGLPAMFGFTVYDSLGDGPEIPYPTRANRAIGGHAILAVGYDDAKDALLIKNSWGREWGDNGYGWLPYEYVTTGLADDFWSLAKAGFLDFE